MSSFKTVRLFVFLLHRKKQNIKNHPKITQLTGIESKRKIKYTGRDMTYTFIVLEDACLTYRETEDDHKLIFRSLIL